MDGLHSFFRANELSCASRHLSYMFLVESCLFPVGRSTFRRMGEPEKISFRICGLQFLAHVLCEFRVQIRLRQLRIRLNRQFELHFGVLTVLRLQGALTCGHMCARTRESPRLLGLRRRYRRLGRESGRTAAGAEPRRESGQAQKD